MAQEAREQKTGAASLFADSAIKPPTYVASPPVQPQEYLAALLAAPEAAE